jgi:diaminohydroxyphosphoribosylaminopyrimidine deaminase/5-amino-6-(5-phosphoribosylamino)uracil reductase
VVAREGEVLGEGWHQEYGGAHAEVNAIEACGLADLAGATIYVSLEPCCHEGKTPPCTDAIIQSGIRRVVIASDDPTEKASGRGLGILRDEGIDVIVADGDVASSARLLNQAFRKHARVGRPWVLFKSAMTLDGKVATRTGDSKWISGEDSRDLAHRWRASVDAVVVGIGTALADDPQLTARPSGLAAEPHAQPRRVVFDSLARVPPTSQLVVAAAEIPLSLIVSRAAARADTDALEAAGVQVIVATGENEPARVRSALDQLGAMDVSAVLLEGGPHLAGAFFDAGEIDEVRLFLAPMLLGGSSARDPLEGEGVERISDAMKALTMSCETIGEDLLISARLREW